ncbi:hypothetical protein [Bradyrhizobium sp. SZCCHNR2012]|uniref:hypothetical protein n=1 Tax=Bradyrhizobium sp. SZCCHNR2012 TaxID=3057377 RepID=UPI0028EA66C4|nr:hypothetical protein [Bradyrhizobium sp. SZCCHNR2012]
MLFRSSLTLVCLALALIFRIDSAGAGYVQSWLDTRGGCSPGPLMLMRSPLRGRPFLGKAGPDWTDADVDEFRQVYAACTRRNPVVNLMKLDATQAQIDAHIEEVVAKLRENVVGPARRNAEAQTAKMAAERELAQERQAQEEQRQVKAAQEAQEIAAEADRREAARREREREQAARDRQAKEAREVREEQQRETIAREDRERDEAAARQAAEKSARTRLRLQEQAEQDRRATEELLKQAEEEERKTSILVKEAEAAHQARAAAEQRLAELRRKAEAVVQEGATTKSASDNAAQKPDQAFSKDDATPTLDLVAADFGRLFNDQSASMGFDLRASSKGCRAAVRTACQFGINERIGVVVSADNGNPRATGVTVIYAPEDDPAMAFTALSSFMVVARMLSPSLARAKDNKFVTRLFVGLKDKPEGEATADGIRYQISSGAAGVWFTATGETSKTAN